MKRIYINEDVCIGCGLCQVYCATEHSVSKDVVRAHKRENPVPLARLRVERRAEVAFSSRCRHCDEPACVYACLTGAMRRDLLTGLVTVDTDKCMGCWTCLLACPSGAIVMEQSRKVAAKCDFCPGRNIPVCVEYCPQEALVLVEDNDVKAEVPREKVSVILKQEI